MLAPSLDDQQRERLAQYFRELTGKEIQMTTNVDESIVAGLVVRVGDRLMDGSARTKLGT